MLCYGAANKTMMSAMLIAADIHAWIYQKLFVKQIEDRTSCNEGCLVDSWRARNGSGLLLP